jgi:hypothetical protein
MPERRNPLLLSALIAVSLVWLCVWGGIYVVEGRAADRAMKEYEVDMRPPAQPGASYATQVYWGQLAAKAGHRTDQPIEWQRRAVSVGLLMPIGLIMILWLSKWGRRRLTLRKGLNPLQSQ